jgi:hypothetical protein
MPNICAAVLYLPELDTATASLLPHEDINYLKALINISREIINAAGIVIYHTP